LLKQEFNQKKTPHLVTFNFTRLDGDLLEIDAVVNAVNYIKET